VEQGVPSGVVPHKVGERDGEEKGETSQASYPMTLSSVGDIPFGTQESRRDELHQRMLGDLRSFR
jgi:hypothetical protein